MISETSKNQDFPSKMTSIWQKSLAGWTPLLMDLDNELRFQDFRFILEYSFRALAEFYHWADPMRFEVAKSCIPGFGPDFHFGPPWGWERGGRRVLCTIEFIICSAVCAIVRQHSEFGENGVKSGSQLTLNRLFFMIFGMQNSEDECQIILMISDHGCS